MARTTETSDSCTIIIKNLPLVRGYTGIKDLIKKIHYFMTANGGHIIKEKGAIYLPLETSPYNLLDTHTRGFGFIKLKDRKNAMKLVELFKVHIFSNFYFEGKETKIVAELAVSQSRGIHS